MEQKTFTYLSWSAVISALALAVYVWGGSVHWNIGNLNAYQWFPLFGLIAWMIMAEHYYLGTIRLTFKNLEKPKWFKPITGYIVLASMLLHPGLLAYEQSKNNQGLPPDSYVNYVGEGLRIAVMLGVISLIIFLSFEVFERVRENKFVKKIWLLVSLSQSLAMTLIWVHALRLGSHLGDGWFQTVWIILGIALLPCFYIIHREDFRF